MVVATALWACENGVVSKTHIARTAGEWLLEAQSHSAQMQRVKVPLTIARDLQVDPNFALDGIADGSEENPH